jgi:hypothetical protein
LNFNSTLSTYLSLSWYICKCWHWSRWWWETTDTHFPWKEWVCIVVF